MHERYVWYNHTTFYLNTMKKKNICVLESVMFYEKRRNNATKAFRVLSCVTYTIIENIFLYWLSSLSIKEIKWHMYIQNIFGNVLMNSWIWEFQICWWTHCCVVVLVSWFCEEHKFYCCIVMSFMDFGILFFKRVCYLGTQFKSLIDNCERSKINKSCNLYAWFRLCYDLYYINSLHIKHP